jgi:hypothetical protein
MRSMGSLHFVQMRWFLSKCSGERLRQFPAGVVANARNSDLHNLNNPQSGYAAIITQIRGIAKAPQVVDFERSSIPALTAPASTFVAFDLQLDLRGIFQFPVVRVW